MSENGAPWRTLKFTGFGRNSKVSSPKKGRQNGESRALKAAPPPLATPLGLSLQSPKVPSGAERGVIEHIYGRSKPPWNLPR